MSSAVPCLEKKGLDVAAFIEKRWLLKTNVWLL